MGTKVKVAFALMVTSAVTAMLTTATCSAAPRHLAAPASRAGLKMIDLAALRKVVNATAKEMKVPGAVVLLRTPQGEFSVNYGTTQLGTTKPPDMHTNFRIASNTKTMTAALILLLAQENKLTLDDPVSKYVSDVPNGNKITIANLLDMRSGLYNYTDSPILSESIDRTPTKVWSPKEVLAIAFKQPSKPPNKEFQYNNTNYILLGLVVEKVGGKPLSQAMHDRFFVPLHLADTTLPEASSNAISEPYSHGYLYGSSSVALYGTPSYSAKFKAAAQAGKILPKDYTNVNHSFAGAAGGVTSNAADLATWISALTTGSVFGAEYQRRWLESCKLEDPKRKDGQQYGYGIARMQWGAKVPNMYYFHGGETAGYNSFIGYDPTNKVTLVVWTNLTVSLDEMPTANSIMLKVLDNIYVVSPTPTKKTP